MGNVHKIGSRKFERGLERYGNLSMLGELFFLADAHRTFFTRAFASRLQKCNSMVLINHNMETIVDS